MIKYVYFFLEFKKPISLNKALQGKMIKKKFKINLDMNSAGERQKKNKFKFLK